MTTAAARKLRPNDVANDRVGCKLTIDDQVDTSTVVSIVRDVLAALPASAGTETRVLALYHWVREALFVYPCSPDDLCEDFNKALQLVNWWGYGLCGTQSKVFGILVAHLSAGNTCAWWACGSARWATGGCASAAISPSSGRAWHATTCLTHPTATLRSKSSGTAPGTCST